MEVRAGQRTALLSGSEVRSDSGGFADAVNPGVTLVTSIPSARSRPATYQAWPWKTSETHPDPKHKFQGQHKSIHSAGTKDAAGAVEAGGSRVIRRIIAAGQQERVTRGLPSRAGLRRGVRGLSGEGPKLRREAHRDVSAGWEEVGRTSDPDAESPACVEG